MATLRVLKDYLVQCIMTPGHRASTGSQFNVYLPSPTRAGNCLVAFCTYASGVTLSVADGTNGTWSNPQNPVDAGNADALSAFYFPNTAAGVRKVQFTFSGQASFLQFWIGEFRQIATVTPLDNSAGGGGNSTTSWAPGSFSTTSDGDFILSGIIDTQGAPGFTIMKPDASLFDGQMLSCDSIETGFAVQAGIQLAHGALNPTITTSATDAFLAIGLAFKTSVGAGTAPPAPGPNTPPRIIRVAGYNLGFTGNSFTTIFPCSGSLIHGTYVGADGTTNIPVIKSATDSKNNSYQIIPGVVGATQGAGQVNFAYTRGSTPSDQLSIAWTLSKTSSPITATLLLYDIEGADPVVMPVIGNTGTDLTGANITMLSITPQVPNSLTLIGAGVEGGTLKEFVGAGYLNDNAWWLEEDITVTTFYENNGWGHFTSSDTSPQTFVWTPTSPTTTWTAKAIAYAPVRGVGRPIAPALRR